jgi:hypothetical protein
LGVLGVLGALGVFGTFEAPKGGKAVVDPDYSPTAKSASKVAKDNGRATAVTGFTARSRAASASFSSLPSSFTLWSLVASAVVAGLMVPDEEDDAYEEEVQEDNQSED